MTFSSVPIVKLGNDPAIETSRWRPMWEARAIATGYFQATVQVVSVNGPTRPILGEIRITNVTTSTTTSVTQIIGRRGRVDLPQVAVVDGDLVQIEARPTQVPGAVYLDQAKFLFSDVLLLIGPCILEVVAGADASAASGTTGTVAATYTCGMAPFQVIWEFRDQRTPKIWLPGTLSPGDTTWTSSDGDVRTLSAQSARTISDPGVMLDVTNVARWTLSEGDDLYTDMTGDIVWEIDMTCFWEPQGGAGFGETQFPKIYDGNGILFLTGPGDWSGIEPPAMALTDLVTGPPTTDGIIFYPSLVGISGWARAQVRITYNTVTGAASGEMRANGGAWISAGSATFTGVAGLPFGGYIDHASFLYLDQNFPEYTAPYVVHSESLSNNATNKFVFNPADISSHTYLQQYDLALGKHQVGTRINGTGIGNANVTPATLGQLEQYLSSTSDSRAAFVNGGVPFIIEKPSGVAAALFTGGADLIDPIILASPPDDPAAIYVIRGVQPTVFNGEALSANTYLKACYVWAVADAGTFTNLSALGWPDGFYPFGATTTASGSISGPWTLIPGATGTTYSFTADAQHAGRQFQMTVTDVLGTTATSAPITFTLSGNLIPQVTSEQADVTTTNGSVVAMTWTWAGGESPRSTLVEQRISSSDPWTTYDTVAGITAGTGTTTVNVTATATTGYQYRFAIIDATPDTVYSRVMTLTVVAGTGSLYDSGTYDISTYGA